MQELFVFAVPVFTLFMAVEWFASRRRARARGGYEGRDTAASLAMGLGSVLLGLAADLALVAFVLGVNAVVPWQVPLDAWWGWALAIIAVDFAFYWCHRAHHELRVFWAAHVNHHSSQRFNYSTALRQSWTEPFTSIPFLGAVGLLGVPPEMVLGAFGINLLYQFLTHTELVGRLGPLEWVMNTPSHHRVHHGSNVRYLDRNYAGILIIWDRLFGTFEPEGEEAIYGLTSNIDTYNPLRIAFHEWVALGRDVLRAPDLRTAARYLLRPPGWHPEGRTRTARELRAGQLEA